MGASTKASLTTRESRTEKTGHVSSHANRSNVPALRKSPIDQISFLQRTVGNREVERMLKFGMVPAKQAIGQPRLGLQAKLKVNEPGDIYEQEADRISDQVLANPSHAAIGGTAPGMQGVAGQAVGETATAPASVDQGRVP
jgi:hypothetical protein